MLRLFLVQLVFASLVLFSCKQPDEIVPIEYQPKHLHEGYILSLVKAGLSETALAKEWIEVGENALRSPKLIESPHQEEFYMLAHEVSAYSYKIKGIKGQKIKVSVEQTAGDSTVFYLDAYRIAEDSLSSFKLIASADDAERVLAFEVVEDGLFVIRFQNQLLRKGQFRIKIINVPSLEFPVSGGKTHDIGSLFGVPRDAGKRRHEGIDIFARRHTPIIAPSDGNINWAGVRAGSLGGKVIWMRDTVRNQTLYFAHLEDVLVKDGEKVTTGDTIGSVGNSGNAITTAPHLHFGIYQDGAVDPYHHVVTTRTRPSRILANNELLGQLVRTKRNTNLRLHDNDERSSLPINKHQLLQVNGCYATYYNVSLPNGKEGSIFYDDITTINKTIRKVKYADMQILDTPTENAIITQKIKDEEVEILAASDQDYLYVKTLNGMNGWIQI